MRRADRLFTTLLLALAPTLLAAQGGTIRGRVADAAGAPLARALVAAEGAGLRATSDQQGQYEIRGVPAGSYLLRARLLGHVPQTARVTVGEGATVQQDFALAAQAISLSPVDVVVGSRARHTAAEELAVPVDVFTAEMLSQQGTSETSQILQALAPSINFPRQSVTDATDIVRPFTLRGLSPDHTLVLVNGLRRHQTALVNTFAYGTGAGSSGVDFNAVPTSALDRIEVLRDGAAAQYGSDAIAGVINVVLREGRFDPTLSVTSGRYIADNYADDGTTADVSGGVGLGVGRGSLALFAEVLNREPTNRAWADSFDTGGIGTTDVVDWRGRVVTKRNGVPQPNHHWGDGLERDVLTFANFRLPLNDAGTREVYSFGGYSFRRGTGNGYRRYAESERNWPQIYPIGFLPEFNPDVTDYSAAAGVRAAAGGWSLDIGAAFGHNDFEYNLRSTLNASLGPCLTFTGCTSPAPGPDGLTGTTDDMVNQTEFFAGRLTRDELVATFNAARALEIGLAAPLNLAVGAAFRRESYRIAAGETASWIDGGHVDQFGADAPGGSQVFPGFAPSDEADESRTNTGVFADLETKLSPELLANVAGRFESYSDFGELVTGKAAVRFQPTREFTIRAAASTGFRAPGLAQSHFSKVVTNVIGGTFEEVGIFPVGESAARVLGAKRLKEERAVNLSAGFAFTPVENLTITVDYFHITIEDRILLGATFDDAATQAILADSGITGVTGVQYFTNGLDTRTQGADITASLRVPVGQAGTLDLAATLNHTKNEITRVDPLPQVLQDRSSTEPGIIDSVTWIAIEDERPDRRATMTAQYFTGRFRLLLRSSYFGRFSSAQPGFCDQCRERYGAKTLYDAEVGYRLGQVNAAMGIRNLFDTYPDRPKDDFNNNFGTFPWAAASPFGFNGRYVYARVEMRLQ